MKAAAIPRVKFVPGLMAVLMMSLLVLSCGSDGGGGGGGTPTMLVAEGWSLFSEGNYSQAVSKFNAAADQDSDLAEAYDGLGWSYARLGMLQSSVDKFTFVLSVLVDPSQDTYAGASMAHLAAKNYEDASNMSNWALVVYGDTYEFDHDNDVTDTTLRLVRAISRFHLGLYESASDDVEELGGPTLSPGSANFVAKLLEAIQDLREQYGQGLLDT
jgi:tetratricopeptide (TPR) repeat protein